MEQKGFFKALFDTSFSAMITVRIIQWLYVLALLGIGLMTLLFVVAAFADSASAGLIVLILSPLIFLISAVFARIYLEMAIVIFKIADNTAEMAASATRKVEPPNP
jgi:uncharacterized membrane protein